MNIRIQTCLTLYNHPHDEDSQQAMLALTNASADAPETVVVCKGFSVIEDSLRTEGDSKKKSTPQEIAIQELMECLSNSTERGGFEPPVREPHTRFPSVLLKPLGHLS